MLGLLAVNAAFMARGEAGTYTPDGGVPGGSILIVVDRTAETLQPDDYGGTRAGQVSIDVRKSECAAPAAKGVFTLTGSGEAFRVHSKPKAADAQGYVWTMMAVPT
jgi:hypothetical protein